MNDDQKKQRNDANNANLVKNAAAVAENSGHPVASAIGKGVKIADKVSGGKATEKLGKLTTVANKAAGLNGKLLQAAANKLVESGAANKIGQAAAKKGSSNGKSGTADRINKAKNKNQQKPTLSKNSSLGKGMLSSQSTEDSSLKDAQDQASDGGDQSFQIAYKVVKWIAILSAPTAISIVFICLLTSASQVFIKSIGLGNADNVSREDAESTINEELEEEDDINEEVDEDDLAIIIPTDDKEYLTFSQNKFQESNLIKTKSTTYKERENNEADLEKLKDFYPPVTSLSKIYGKNMVYKFYFKMLNLYNSYKDNYNVYLDLPLIMATLSMQSNDMNIVFSSNLSDDENYDYYYDWSNYISTPDKSTHDMEVLAQNMVSERPAEECQSLAKNNKCYVIDEEKYKEFLKSFIEKKYYVDQEITIGDNTTKIPSEPGAWKSWTQCGQTWSDMIVPTSKSNMCQIGCLVTSISIQIARSGTATVENPMDPGVALGYFSFVNGGNLVLASPSKLAPNFKYYTNLNFIGMSKKSIAEKINSYNLNKYYFVLGVSPFESSQVTHYVALDYADTATGNIYMMDPVSTEYTDLYSKYKLYHAYLYVKED